jgi:ADP-heptose:LPS heptosyltransferase
MTIRPVKELIKKLIRIVDSLIAGERGQRASLSLALVRLDAIGDFVIWLDSAKEYRQLYPNHKITLIANEAWADWAREFSYWDDVWSVKLSDFIRNPFYRWAFLKKVSREHFGTAIQPTYSRDLMAGDSIIRATGAQHRIGSVGDTSIISPKSKAMSDGWYTRLVPANPEPMMELLRNAEFMSHLAGKSIAAALPHLPLQPDLPMRQRPLGDYFILFPGASWRGRQWSDQNFADVLSHLYKQYGWSVVLCGSLAERELCARIAVPDVPCLNLAGKTNLAELAEWIRHSRILVSNETSAVHIAAAVGAPVVCILGGGHFGRFLPYPDELDGIKPMVVSQLMPCFNCNWQCNQPHDDNGPVPCIRDVSVTQVLAGVQESLLRANPAVSNALYDV